MVLCSHMRGSNHLWKSALCLARSCFFASTFFGGSFCSSALVSVVLKSICKSLMLALPFFPDREGALLVKYVVMPASVVLCR